MLKRALILLFLALTQGGCEVEDLYHPLPTISEEERERIEQTRRELLQLQDLQIGNGSVATWGRKITAAISVRYADGTTVYNGPIVDYVGFQEILNMEDPNYLSFFQRGIMLGLHGMAIGGKRRITIDASQVCTNVQGGANPKISCNLTNRGFAVRKEQLIVEATLTESCIPVGTVMSSALGRKTKETDCRRSDLPQRDPSAPIWRVY